MGCVHGMALKGGACLWDGELVVAPLHEAREIMIHIVTHHVDAPFHLIDHVHCATIDAPFQLLKGGACLGMVNVSRRSRSRFIRPFKS